MQLGQITKLLDYSARHDTIRILRAWPLKPKIQKSIDSKTLFFSFEFEITFTQASLLFFVASHDFVFPRFLVCPDSFCKYVTVVCKYICEKIVAVPNQIKVNDFSHFRGDPS